MRISYLSESLSRLLDAGLKLQGLLLAAVGGDAVLLLDAYPPEPVQVLPALMAQLLDGPGAAVLGVLIGSQQRLVLGVEELPEPVVRVDLDVRRWLVVRRRLRHILLPHVHPKPRPRPVDAAQPSQSIVIAARPPHALRGRGGKGTSLLSLLLLLLGRAGS